MSVHVANVAEFPQPQQEPTPDSIPWGSAMEWRRILGSPYCPLRPTTKWVLTVLSRYGDKYGHNIYPSQRELAYRAGVSAKTVNAALQKAEKEGWVVRKEMGRQWGRGYKHHVYELTIPAYVWDLKGNIRQFWEPPHREKLVKKGEHVHVVDRYRNY